MALRTLAAADRFSAEFSRVRDALRLARRASLLLLLNAAVATAQEVDPESAHGRQEHHAEHHANHLAVLVGASTFTGELPEGSSGTAFTLGVEYERRVTRVIGFGFLADYAPGGLGRAFLLGVPLFVRPVAGLGLTLAPGVEFEEEEAEELETRSSSVEGTHTSTHFTFRVGAFYAFPLSSMFSLVPQFNADFISGKGATLVYGLAFGFGF